MFLGTQKGSKQLESMCIHISQYYITLTSLIIAKLFILLKIIDYSSLYILQLPYIVTYNIQSDYMQCFHFAGNFLISGNPDLKRKFSGSQEISGNLMKSQENQEISKNLMTSITFYLFNVNFLNS